ncbi:MAG TPA: hypothetical protein VKD90_05625 [Gemmataceae bacterium]|nr:hypothetical protein [Gemmataceae bacterium]
MTLRCPVCRAENAAGPICRRCRADLSLLVAVEARRDHHLAAARTALSEGRFDDGIEELVQADELRHGPDIHRLRACAFLLAGDFPCALAEHAAAGPQ